MSFQPAINILPAGHAFQNLRENDYRRNSSSTMPMGSFDRDESLVEIFATALTKDVIPKQCVPFLTITFECSRFLIRMFMP